MQNGQHYRCLTAVCEVDYNMHVCCRKETQVGIKSVEEVRWRGQWWKRREQKRCIHEGVVERRIVWGGCRRLKDERRK